MSHTLFLFQFFHEIDIKRVLESGPWTFDQHILIVRRLGEDEQPHNVPLFHTSFWVQVYNLPIGFQSEKVLQSIGSYIISFLESYVNNLTGIRRNYICLKVSIDVRHPLKRRMRIKKAGGKWFWVDFKYERLHIFCHICVLLGHTKRTCPTLYESAEPVAKPYGQWMRAPNRKSSMNSGDRWLRSAPLGKEDQSFRNYTKSAEVIAVDFDGATKSVIDGSNNHGMATNGGIVLNKEIQIILTPCT